jgi:hypothetical protein
MFHEYLCGIDVAVNQVVHSRWDPRLIDEFGELYLANWISR